MVIQRHFFWFLRLFVFLTVKVQKYQRLPAKCPLESLSQWILDLLLGNRGLSSSATRIINRSRVAMWGASFSHSPPFNVLPLESSPSVCTMGWVRWPKSPEPALRVTTLSQMMPEEVHPRKETFSSNWVPNFQTTSQKLLIETHSFSSD